MRWNIWNFAMMALLVSASVASAQERAAQAPRERREDRVTSSAHQNADHMIANCLAIADHEEIGLAKLAVAHAENPKVKQLAEMLIKDHQRCLTDLKKFGAEEVALRTPGHPQGVTRASATSEVARDENGQRPETQRTAARESGGLNFLEIKREMADKCLQSAEKEWNDHRGAEADKCFVGSQIVLHQQMLNAQEVLKKHSSQELQALIDKGIAATQNHLTQAKELMKELEGARSPRTNN